MLADVHFALSLCQLVLTVLVFKCMHCLQSVLKTTQKEYASQFFGAQCIFAHKVIIRLSLFAIESKTIAKNQKKNPTIWPITLTCCCVSQIILECCQCFMTICCCLWAKQLLHQSVLSTQTLIFPCFNRISAHVFANYQTFPGFSCNLLVNRRIQRAPS